MRLVALAALALLASCAPTAAPSTSLPPSLPAAQLATVRVERVEVPGYPEPHTPDGLDRAIYLRYSAASSARPRAVVVFMPGLLGGASGFDRIARGLVSRDPSLEAWAVDRRSNLLEDHSLLVTALAEGKGEAAWNYYVRDAGKPEGFQPVGAQAAAYAGYWGLAVTLGDLRAVIERARAVSDRVILAGHSLGASLVTQYAGWDFAGRAGWQDLAGLVLLDGAPGALGFERVDEDSYRNGLDGFFGARTPGIAALEGGQANPFLGTMGLDAFGFARSAAAALLASLDPHGDSPGGIVPYPASNLAAALVQIDDDYALVDIFSASAGRAEARLGANVLALFVRGLEGLRAASVVGPAEGKARVEWLAPAPDDPKELTDPLDLVRSYHVGQADFAEWYFPVRLTLDVAAANLEAPEWARGNLPLTRLRGMPLPVLALVASRGIATAEDAFSPLQAVTGKGVERRVLPGYTHLDVLTARSSLVADEIAAFTRR
jgi:hypothetical protein